MADQRKVHVFVGAPSLSEEVVENVSSEWTTLELSWIRGSLRPKEKLEDAQTGSVEKPSSTSDRENLDNFIKQVSKSTSEDDVTPLISQSLLVQPVHPEKEDLSTKMVNEYLDSCFPSQVRPGPDSETSSVNPGLNFVKGSASLTPRPGQDSENSSLSPGSGPAPDNSSVSPGSGPDYVMSPVISLETEYLTTWTQSQCLLLKSRTFKDHERASLGFLESMQTPPKHSSPASLDSPELYSPEVSPGDRGLGGTLQGSGKMFESPSQWLQERGVFLLRTPDGMLFSQSVPVEQKDPCPPDTSIEGSPIVPTTSKRLRLSSDRTSSNPRTVQDSVFLHEGHTTLLSRCRSHGKRYTVLVAAVDPCHLKEIRVKTGPSAGTHVPLASVIITDQSHVEIKLVLWRAAAFWALTIHPGDVILITGVMVHVDKWRGETVLQSSYMSRLLNLGQITTDRRPQAPGSVHVHTFRELCTYLYESRPLLVSLPYRSAQDLKSIPFARLGSLRLDTLAHALLRVKNTTIISVRCDQAEGVSRTGNVPKAVLTVEQYDGTRGAVVLWGAALTWLQHIHTNTDAVWEFRLLLVKQDITSGLPELHSTPFSSCQLMPKDDLRYEKFCTPVRPHQGPCSFEIDLRTLLSQKYTGDVELRVQITSFDFQSSPSQGAVQPMDQESSLKRILDILSGDITFTGCGLCRAELDTDENGIYRPCYPCLPHTGVRRYYRPVVLTVREGQNQIAVQVPPAMVQKILLDIPPDKLNKKTAPESDERFVQVVAKRIHALLSTPRLDSHLVIRSYFKCDENSVPIIQNFLLIDFITSES